MISANTAYDTPETLKKLWIVKENISEKTKNMNAMEIVKYFHEETQKILKQMGKTLIKNPDGPGYRMVNK